MMMPRCWEIWYEVRRIQIRRDLSVQSMGAVLSSRDDFKNFSRRANPPSLIDRLMAAE
jgi:hypothetical protein